MRRTVTRLLALAALAAVPAALGAACSEDSSPEFVETLCTAGSALCQGNTAFVCAADGKSYEPSSCGKTQACVAGACQQRTCFNPGGSSCKNGTTLLVCSPDGLSQDEEPCGAGESCVGGLCLAGGCSDGATRCGSNAVLTCSAGTWAVTGCGADEVCTETSGAAACGPQLCVPQSIWCDPDGATANLCKLDGSGSVATPCGGSQVCKDGLCQAKVAGIDDQDVPDAAGDTGAGDTGAEDTGAEDTGPPDTEPDTAIPPLEKISRIEFTLNGVPNTFDFNAMADYVAGDSNLAISGSKGGRKIEINIAPIDPFVVGSFTDTDAGEVGVLICYFDGLAEHEQTAPNCTVGFSHSSTVYAVTLDENNGVGSRVIGTFSTTLEGPPGDVLTLTEGKFDVLHK